jgi:uncharacterized protein
METHTRKRVSFQSDGETCKGYLYFPNGIENVPCVVTANGFTGTMDWILPGFADAFAKAGIAVLIFDYRHLGESDGEPRQIVSVKKQMADLACAVEFARAYQGINPEKIALWGTSLGGSHVVNFASKDASIAAVIANMPALDVIRGANHAEQKRRRHVSTAYYVWITARLLFVAAVDALCGFLNLPPRHIKVYGKPGQAAFTDPELAPLFQRVEEQSPWWKNYFAPRFLFEAPRYRQGTFEKITAPILFTLAAYDTEVSRS